MELVCLEIYCKNLKIDIDYEKSVSDKLIQLEDSFQKLKIEILTNKLKYKDSQNDYFELLKLKLSNLNIEVENHYLIVVKYWLEYYNISFLNVLEGDLPKEFNYFFVQDDLKVFKENPSSKEFQIAFTKSICYKYYQKLINYIFEKQVEASNMNVISSDNQNKVIEDFIELFCDDEKTPLLNYQEEQGFKFYYEFVLGFMVEFVIDEIESNILNMDTPKILYYIGRLKDKFNALEFNNSKSLLVERLSTHLNLDVNNFPFLNNENIFDLLYGRKSLKDLKGFKSRYYDSVIYGFVYHSLYLKTNYLKNYIENLQAKFFLYSNTNGNSTLNVTSFEDISSLDETQIIDVESEVEEINKEVPYSSINKKDEHTIFRNKEGLDLFNRIYDELSIVPLKRGSQTRFMAIYKDSKSRDFIFKAGTTLTAYIHFLNQTYGTKFNSKSKSQGGRHIDTVKNVYNIHLKDIKENSVKPS